MNLKITNYNNFCTVKGVLDKTHVPFFLDKLRDILFEVDSLTMSLEGLDHIDAYGMKALNQIHNEFIKYKKHLSIIGLRGNGVYRHFKKHTAA
ncbi:STAS domain-containing protein [Aegicerativicinus sediminis]|uniref:STAS domain-containing protein n=1 Tax=Aegicerativicinus sediminis TaxID=2893202 RepID=UPI001E58E428|nr:STAS domain-containing protein [Aegicerativicinus sediminis]